MSGKKFFHEQDEKAVFFAYGLKILLDKNKMGGGIIPFGLKFNKLFTKVCWGALILNEIRCPKCGSENVQSCQMIYMDGTVDISMISKTKIGIGDNVKTVTEGESSNRLAQAVSPPKRKSTYWIWFAFFIMSAFSNILVGLAGGQIGNVVLAVIPILLARWIYKKNKANAAWNDKEYQEIYQNWLNSFVCRRCGTMFVRE